MPSQQEEFKQRLAAVLSDLQEDGKHDVEAMWLIGSLAAGLVDKAGAKTWADFKHGLNEENYKSLLADLQTEGNRQFAEGGEKKAYAVQAIAVSLVGMTLADQKIASGVLLLDQMLAAAVALYRQNADLGRPTLN